MNNGEESIVGAFAILKDAVRYLFDSRGGQLSLKSHLNIISKMTDEFILNTENEESLKYDHGICTVGKSKQHPNKIGFTLEFFFRDKNGNLLAKGRYKEELEATFTAEALRLIKEKEQNFSIDRPQK